MLERLANIFNLIKLGVINYAIAMFVFDNNVDEMFVEKNILSFINVVGMYALCEDLFNAIERNDKHHSAGFDRFFIEPVEWALLINDVCKCPGQGEDGNVVAF